MRLIEFVPVAGFGTEYSALVSMVSAIVNLLLL